MRTVDRSQINWILNKRLISGSRYPDGPFRTQSATYYPEPIGGSTAFKRYQTELDGQDDFWIRGEEYITSPGDVIGVVFTPNSFSGKQSFFDGSSGVSPVNASQADSTGFIGADANVTIVLNGTPISSGTTAPILGDINHAEFTDVSGGRRIGLLGTDLGASEFYSGVIHAISLNGQVYKPSGNAPYELPIGVELGPEQVSQNPSDWQLTDCAITFANGRLRVTNTAASQGVAALPLPVDMTGLSAVVELNGRTGAGEGWVTNPFQGMGAVDNFLVASFTSSGQLSIRSNGTQIGDFVEYDIPSLRQVDPDSILTFENGEPDGSDRKLITRKADNSGWVGESAWNLPDYVSTGSEGAFVFVQEDTSVKAGTKVDYKVTVSGLTAGQYRFWVGNMIAEAITADGVYSGSEIADSDSLRTQIGNVQVNAGATIAVEAAPAYDYAPGANP